MVYCCSGVSYSSVTMWYPTHTEVVTLIRLFLSERRSTFGDFFSRRNSLTSMRDWAKGRESPRRLLRESSGFRYINRPSRGASPQPADNAASSREILKTKNAVYCALILEEFTKELAAISQEHAVVNLHSRTNM